MKETSLPKGYNEITELPGFWVLEKNPQLLPADEMYFKGIWIEWAYDPATEAVKIRKLIYPKETYSRESVEKIAENTYNCPFCRIGKKIMSDNWDLKNLYKYVSSENSTKISSQFTTQKTQNGEPKMEPFKIPGIEELETKGITSFLDPISKYLSEKSEVPTGQISTILGGELLAALVEIPIDLFTTALGRKIIKGAVGAGILALAGTGVIKRRLAAEAMEYASHWIAEAFDPSKETMLQLKSDVQNLRSALQLGDLELGLKSLFTPPAEVTEAAKSLGTSLFGEIPSLGPITAPTSPAPTPTLPSMPILGKPETALPSKAPAPVFPDLRREKMKIF